MKETWVRSESGRSPGEGNGNPLLSSCWKMPWMEEPGGLQSMASQRVGHNWETNTFTFHLQQPSIILGVGGYRDKQNKVHTLTELIFYLGSQRILVSNKWYGNPLQYSCLENTMDGGAWWATVHGVTKSRKWLSDCTKWCLQNRQKW